MSSSKLHQNRPRGQHGPSQRSLGPKGQFQPGGVLSPTLGLEAFSGKRGHGEDHEGATEMAQGIGDIWHGISSMRQDLKSLKPFCWGGVEAESLKWHQIPTFRLQNWDPRDPGAPVSLMAASWGLSRLNGPLCPHPDPNGVTLLSSTASFTPGFSLHTAPMAKSRMQTTTSQFLPAADPSLGKKPAGSWSPPPGGAQRLVLQGQQNTVPSCAAGEQSAFVGWRQQHCQICADQALLLFQPIYSQLLPEKSQV